MRAARRGGRLVVSELVVGLALLALAAVIAFDAQRLAPGSMYGVGPSVAPMIIAGGLGLGFVLTALPEQVVAWLFSSIHSLVNPLLALGAGINAYLLLKRKSWLLGVLMVLMTLVLVGSAIVSWGHLAQLIGG